jgi:hypothetical protein
MIESKDFKIAESTEETLWLKVQKEAEMLIKQSYDNLIIQKAMLKLAKSKLKKYNKDNGKTV